MGHFNAGLFASLVHVPCTGLNSQRRARQTHSGMLINNGDFSYAKLKHDMYIIDIFHVNAYRSSPPFRTPKSTTVDKHSYGEHMHDEI